MVRYDLVASEILKASIGGHPVFGEFDIWFWHKHVRIFPHIYALHPGIANISLGGVARRAGKHFDALGCPRYSGDLYEHISTQEAKRHKRLVGYGLKNNEQLRQLSPQELWQRFTHSINRAHAKLIQAGKEGLI